MHLGGTLGDTRLVMGSIAYPNKHREQHHQARDDESQGTTEETEYRNGVFLFKRG